MDQHYSKPERADDPHALPDLEVFFRTYLDNKADGWVDADGDVMPAGWYWWSCFPGCLPDSEPMGPFDSEDAALADASDYQG